MRRDRLIGLLALGLMTSTSVAYAAETKAAPAKGPASFEEAASSAHAVKNVAGLFDPLFDECKDGDELAQRQCRIVRDWQLSMNRNERYLSVGDWGSLVWSPYSPAEKQVSLEVQGCLQCEKPVQIAGKPRYVTSRPPKSVKGGKAVGVELGYHDVPVAADEAKQWEAEVARRLRVQYVYRIGPVWKTAQAEGATFVPIAYRVFDPCTGKVVASSPPSSSDAPVITDGVVCPAAVDKKRSRSR